MTYQIISEEFNVSSKDVASRMSQFKVATSYAVVSCRKKRRAKDMMIDCILLRFPHLTN